jgi:putative SOS response-associated peptidase YedK
MSCSQSHDYLENSWAKLLVPCPEKQMAAPPVSALVDNPKFDDPRCNEPVK